MRRTVLALLPAWFNLDQDLHVTENSALILVGCIRIRIGNADPDSDSWEQKCPEKVKSVTFKCCVLSFESWRLLLYLVCPSRMPGDKYVAI
jgi:hypothetical protein